MELTKMHRFASVVVLLFGILLQVNANNCESGTLAKYNLMVNFQWLKELFPKQYPLFRPPASWTSVVGRSHDADYVLWREGGLASAGLKQLTEIGKTDELDKESQGAEGILDVFKVPALGAGVGTSKADFFVDSNHPRVSLVSKVNPSPDWFVGVDNLMLCKNGEWAPELTMELGPWDAGTDKGFTFTAPNWPEVPQVPIAPITSKFPDHPANGFFYPEKSELPPLAKITFKRVGIYRQKEGNDVMAYENMNNLDNSGEVYNNYKNVADQPNALPNRQPIVYEELPAPKQANVQTYSGNHINTPVTPSRRRKLRGGRRGRKTGRKMGRRPNGRKVEPTGSEIKPMGTDIKPAGSGIKPSDAPVACEVSQWTDWASCSKTCGFGTRARRRYVAVKPENGGAPCPILVENELCGSMRSCGWRHFRFGPVFRN